MKPALTRPFCFLTIHIACSHRGLERPSDSFLSWFRTKTFHAFHFCLMLVTCHAHLILRDLTIRMIFMEGVHKLKLLIM
jgi:hypothetical protein